MKFLSGCFGKVLRFLLAVLLGVVLTLGGIVGAGYFALMTKGIMGTVSDKVNDSGAGIVPADTARQAREKLGGADARDDALIAAYERVRYSADPSIDDGTVSYLSDKGAQAVKRKKK